MIKKKQKNYVDSLHAQMEKFVYWCIVHQNNNGGTPQPPLTETLLNDMIVIASYHGLTPLVHNYLKSAGIAISDEKQTCLKNTCLWNIRHNLIFEDQYCKLLKIMGANGPTLLPLKGMHLLVTSTATASSRPMCDIDVLVHPNEYEQCENILLENGFQLTCSDKNTRDYWRTQQMHLSFVKQSHESKKRFLLEVHWALDYPRKYPILTQLWERITQINHNNHKISIMSHEDMLFAIALHQRRSGSLLQLKYVVDVGTLFIHHGETLDYKYLIEESKRSKLRTVLYALLQQTNHYYSSPRLTELIRQLHIGRCKKALIRFFQKKYQYIVHDHDRSYLFLIYHMLLFDSIAEPYFYMLFIPYNQFCKFHVLNSSKHSSRIKYEIRHFYGVYRILREVIRKLCLRR